MYRALLICNSIYPDDPAGLPELNGPQADGLLLWRVLTDAQKGLVAADHTRVLFERTSREILVAAEDFFVSAQPNDILIFYFSGHGRRSGGSLFLCGRDSVSSRTVSTAVSAESLRHVIDRSPAGASVVLLDCCHSGAFKGPDDLSKDFKGAGRFVIAASRASELAKDSDQQGEPSPFTGALVSALSGAAEDLDGDGYIDIEDVYKIVSGKLAGGDAPEPRKSFDGSGTIPLARVDVEPSAVDQVVVSPGLVNIDH
jgi:hypothetical protein